MLTLVFSCRTVKYIPGETIIKDSVVFKDTSVYITVPPIVIPGERLTLHDTVPCPDAQWKGTAKSLTGRTTINAEINNGKIKIDCKTDSLIKRIDSLQAVIKYKESYSVKVTNNPVPVSKWYIPWWVWLWSGINLLIIIIILRK